MTFSGDLFATLDLARDGVDAVSSELCGSDDFPRLLPEWFSILWDVIRATTPVLQRAIGSRAACLSASSRSAHSST